MLTALILFLSLVTLILLVLLAAHLRFNARIQTAARRLFQQAVQKPGLITEEMLAGLPEPARRYLRCSGVVGKPFISSLRLRQTGLFTPRPGSAAMPVEARQYFSANPPALLWDARFLSAGLPLVRACDRYQDGQGSMQGRLLSLFPIIDAQGEELTQGAMLRHLGELIWFPTAFLEDNIAWSRRDANSAGATLTHAGKCVTATLTFDAEGKLTRLDALRYGGFDGETRLMPWSVQIDAYGVFGGLRVPVAGQVFWNTPQGDFVYFDWQILEIEYNPDRPF